MILNAALFFNIYDDCHAGTILDPWDYHALSPKSLLKLATNRKEKHHHPSLPDCNSERKMLERFLLIITGKSAVQHYFTIH